ncbi:MAG TPA: NAD(P)/FAD-dependent oxidoreductase [Thermoplasmata archaeon]|nr:NAD(P)/FAD-dependent oxidoreductase [Thermoplasmata archaeon]
MPDRYDVAIVGGGHNGLVAATYLARAGRRVVVLESRAVLGGVAATEEIAPGFRAPVAATVCGLLRPEVVRDLNLPGYGYELLPFDPLVTSVGEDGRALRLWRDPAATKAEIAKFSAADADAFGAFSRFLLDIARVLDPLLVRTPPRILDMGRGEQLFYLRLAMRMRKLGKAEMAQGIRFPQMSLRAALGERFESELLKATLSVDALLGHWAGPWSPGTAFGLLRGFFPMVHGGSWGFVKGGMASLTDALVAAAKAAGVALRTDAPVARILIADGRASGVQLASGEQVPATIVASNADPKRTFLGLVEPAELDLEFRQRIEHMRMTGGLAKVNLALRSLPPLRSNGGPAPRIRYGPTLEYLERAYDDAKYGRASKDPYVDATVPSLVDPGLAPSGQHVMSVGVQFAPHTLRAGSWDTEREKLGDRVVDILDGLMPGLEKAIVARQILTPADLEAKFGLTGGHPYHGEMSLDRQFLLRPVPGWGRYRTPIVGLYLCGSGAHPGGGITGGPGYNAAREILKDLPRLAAA